MIVTSMLGKIVPACAALLLFGVVPQALAEEVNLLFVTTVSPVAHLNVRVLHPWAERINEQGKGLVHIDVRDGEAIASPGNFYSRVQDDVAQIAWGLPTSVAGKFRRTLVSGLPFEVRKAEEGSVALWRTYKSGVLDAEYDEIQPLYLITFPPAGFHMAKPMKTLENLNGLKIAVGTKTGSDLLQRLGAAPIALVTSEYYTALQRGTVDGANVQWTAMQPFKLYEVTSYHVEAAFGGAAGMVFMTKKKWNALPEAVRKIIDANSGEAQSRLYGAFWDAVDQEGRDTAKSAPEKHQIVTLPPAIEARWRELVLPVTDEWVKSTPDGAKVLATFREKTAEVRTGH